MGVLVGVGVGVPGSLGECVAVGMLVAVGVVVCVSSNPTLCNDVSTEDLIFLGLYLIRFLKAVVNRFSANDLSSGSRCTSRMQKLSVCS